MFSLSSLNKKPVERISLCIMIGKFYLVLFVLLPVVACVNETISDKKSVWDKEFKYTNKGNKLDYNITVLQEKWLLTTYSRIAESVIGMIEKKPPYDLIRAFINGVIVLKKGITIDSSFTKKVMKFQLPFLAIAVIPLLFAVFVPCGGLLYCVLKKFCRKNKRSKLKELDIMNKSRFIRFISASSVLTAATLILIAAIALLMASNRIEEGIEIGTGMAQNSIDTVIKFVTNTIEELRNLLKQDLDKVFDYSHKIFQVFPKQMSEETVNGLLNRLDPYLNALHELHYIVENKSAEVEFFEMLRQSIVSSSADTEHDVNTIRGTVSHLVTRCDLSGYSACKRFQDFDWNLRYLPEIDNLTDLRPAVAGFQVLSAILPNITKDVEKSRAVLDEFKRDLLNVSEQGFHNFENFTVYLVTLQDSLIKQVDNLSNVILDKTLFPMRDNVKNIHALTWFDAMELRISLALKIPTLLLFVMAFLLFMGLFLGQFAAIHMHVWVIDELNPPMKMARTGKDLILSYLWLFFLTAFVANVLLSGSVLIGSNLTQVCHGLEDNSLFTEVIDNEKTWGGNLLGYLVHGDDSLNMKFSNMLTKCRDGAAVWNTLELHRMFNTTPISNLQMEFFNRFPPFDEIVRYNISTNDTFFPLINISSPSTYGFAPVDTTAISQSKVPTNFDWFDAMRQLEDLKVAGGPYHFDTLFGDVSDARSELSRIEEFKYRVTKNLLNEYIEKSRNVSKTMDRVIDVINTIVTEREKNIVFFQRDNFQTYVDQEITNQVMKGLSKIFIAVTRYTSHLLHQLTWKVGRCSVISEIYDSGKTLICYYATDSVNAIWLALGTLMFVGVLVLPMFLELIHHYKVISLDFDSEEDTFSASLVSKAKLSPWTYLAATEEEGRQTWM